MSPKVIGFLRRRIRSMRYTRCNKWIEFGHRTVLARDRRTPKRFHLANGLRDGIRSTVLPRSLRGDLNARDRVISITTMAESNRSALGSLTRETRRTFLSGDGRAALLEVLPAPTVSLSDQVKWVRELRKTGAAALTGVPGATLIVGGIPALNADYQTIVDDRFPSVVALVVGEPLWLFLPGSDRFSPR